MESTNKKSRFFTSSHSLREVMIVGLIFFCVSNVGAQNVGINEDDPQNTLDVKGNMAVGTNYSGTQVAPANSMIVENKLGVGTINPNLDLEVHGDGDVLINDANGLNPNVILYSNGSEVGRLWGQTGSGAYIRGTNTGWGLRIDNSNNAIFNSKVGIGISSPLFQLDVHNTDRDNARIGYAEVGGWINNDGYAYFGNSSLDHSQAGNYALLQHTSGSTFVNAAGSQSIFFRTNNVTGMLMNSSGELDMQGHLIKNIGNSNTATFENVTTGIVGENKTALRASSLRTNGHGSGMMWIEGSRIDANTTINVGIGQAGDRSPVDIRLGDTDEVYVDTSSDRVGVGTTTPQVKLDVIGVGGATIDLQTTGRIRSNSAAGGVWLSNANDGFVGNSGGNIGFWTLGKSWSLIINKTSGNVGIGTSSPSSKLQVVGTINATTYTATTPPWSDFVFEKSYKLKPLSEVENFIKENSHLPDFPSENELKKTGLNLPEMDAKLLQKIEELTLYVIQLKKEIDLLKEEKN